MARVVQSIFIDPPVAIARLGGSNVPQDAFQWAPASDPHIDAQTVIMPDWSLDVRADGSVSPRLPQRLRFRDGDLVRPVAPFFEVWALVGEADSDSSTWDEVPLTEALLATLGVTPGDVTVRVEAINAKAARRTGEPGLRFGTFPPVEIRADDHAVVPLAGVSPPGARPRMIPSGRSIGLGSVQVMRPLPQPTADAPAWASTVRVDVIRFRFTPARGLMYGPPDAAEPHRMDRGPFPLVAPENAFLNSNTAWVGAGPDTADIVQPGDTYDGAERSSSASFGIVDDTCEARIEVRLQLPARGGVRRRELSAFANVFVGPPDFAPDRRPFVSLADELNDRLADPDVRSRDLTDGERERWVEDLFERVYETVSLFNVDFYRAFYGGSGRAAELRGDRLRPNPLPDQSLPRPTRAMGSRDALRNAAFQIDAATPQRHLPLSEHARSRHRLLSDLDELRTFAQSPPRDRLRTLVRPPFAVDTNENADRTTMQMPPFMRHSNAYPLTLSVWQYRLFFDWVNRVTAAPPAAPAAGVPAPMSAAAAARMRRVLDRLDRGGGPQ
jgi:hypothetical protein